MENHVHQAGGRDTKETLFVVGRTIVAVALAIAILWAMFYFIDRFDWSGSETAINQTSLQPAKQAEASESGPSGSLQAVAPIASVDNQAGVASSGVDHEVLAEAPVGDLTPPATRDAHTTVQASSVAPSASVKEAPSEPTQATAPIVTQQLQSNTNNIQVQAPAAHSSNPPATALAPAQGGAVTGVRPVGTALVDAIVEPLQYELKERFWGWRPNDIINITDNVNNFQLGVLETTRRAVVELAQRISRTGSTDAFDKNLENAMSWIMTKATDYWFPTPESKYIDSLEELKAYKAKLINGSAYFYTRADNLIPLFEVFEDLLGSCDQNLVKQFEADGTKIGTFRADDYFYYAKGVAHAMAIILEGVQIDFSKTMDNRRSGELLLHAIESCRRAAELEPWIVTNSDLDGILANHRANMAAPISHARYYLGQLITTLSV